jgi:DNA-binding transcriptional MerR regulator
LDILSHITGVSRRTILIYCRNGIIHPVIDEPYGFLLFDETSVQAIRRVEILRKTHGINMTGVRMIFNLLEEVQKLRSEVEALRAQD